MQKKNTKMPCSRYCSHSGTMVLDSDSGDREVNGFNRHMETGIRLEMG